MLEITNTDVYGWESAIRGMRNPKNSWDKMDTIWGELREDGKILEYDVPHIGENDLNLMHTLAKAGNDHGKFTRFITVTCDITAPLYWWKEMDQYKVGTVTDSCSTMHKIHDKEFTLDDFSHEHIGDVPNCDPSYYSILEYTIHVLNEARHCFLDTNDKHYWWQMIQLLPSSYNQKRTWQGNYQVIKSIYNARKGHKLDEWQTFREWAESLPYFKEICIDE